MGLLTNGYRDVIGVFRIYGATVSNNCYPQGTRGNYARTGMMRNITAGEGITDDKVGVPMGYGDKGWILPQKGGMMSARLLGLTVDAQAAGLRGMPGEGSSTMTFTADATGGLIASGVGASTFSITTNTPLLTASIGGTGSATFTFTAEALLGAEASVEGSTSFAFTAAADILPLDDTPPARTASASFSITGSLTPYAIGSMIGSTVDSGTLTEAGIANAVWSQAIEAGFTADQILRILAAHAAGAATGLESANPQFTGLDGSTVRIEGEYLAGSRTIDVLRGD